MNHVGLLWDDESSLQQAARLAPCELHGAMARWRRYCLRQYAAAF